jgi:CubicO group peptidase (beta-lactamase class C family)
MADVERSQPILNDTIFRLYSMTKPLTSVLLLMMVQDGLISIDRPVHDYISEWRDIGVYAGGNIKDGFDMKACARPPTIGHLLSHTSGLTYGFQRISPIDAAYRQFRLGELDGPDSSSLVSYLARLPLEFEPGTAWNYSVGTDVVGRIIEIVSNRSLDEVMQERIFQPLGMIDTAFSVPDEKIHRFAACYERKDDHLCLQDDPYNSAFRRPPIKPLGGGGLTSTAVDYLKFCRLLMGETPDLLSHESISLMAANRLPDNGDLASCSRSLFSETSYAGVGFGLGLAVTLDPKSSEIAGSCGDLSWGGMANTYFWVDPSMDLACVFMTQVMPSATYPLRRDLRELVYAAFRHVEIA